MIKILYIISTFKKGGTSVQLLNNIKYLDRTLFMPIVLSLSPEEGNSMLEEFVGQNINISILGFSRIKGFLFGKKELKKKINIIKPRLIHTQGIRGDSYGSVLEKYYPVISTIHNYPVHDYIYRYGLFQGWVMAKHHISVLKKRKNFIACSKNVANLLKEKENISIDYIQNGVDTSTFIPVSNDEKYKIREKLGIQIDKKVFISVGQLVKLKGMKTIIDALNNLKTTGWHFLIAGDGPERQNLKSACQCNSNVSFLGHIDSVKEYLQASDFFVSASWTEGLPNTALEAMACGLPVILTKIQGHMEIFEDNKNYRYFFEIEDYIKLAEILNDILSANYDDLSFSMKAIINNKFNAKTMSEKYQMKYKEILGIV